MMIRIEYGNKFLKDLKKLKNTEIYLEIRKLCFEELPKFDNFTDFPNMKKIIGHSNCFRIRIGNYRIGIRLDNEVIFIDRVLHRKEIYRYFP